MDKNTTMLQLFQRFDDACNNIESLKFIIDSMARVSGLEVASYTADDDNVVLGEVYVINSVGLYKISGVGEGKFSYVIKNPNTLEEIYSGSFDDTAEDSKELYLTYGDLCYLHASADAGKTQTITLQQTKSLFGLMSSKLTEVIQEHAASEARLDNLLEYIKNSFGGLVFNSFQEMEDFIKNPDNSELLVVGRELYIKSTNTTDYWITESLKEPDPETGYYCKITPLEGKAYEVFLTQEEYDALPDTKLTDGVTYRIFDTHPFEAELVAYNNTKSGMKAVDAQNAIDELHTEIKNQSIRYESVGQIVQDLKRGELFYAADPLDTGFVGWVATCSTQPSLDVSSILVSGGEGSTLLSSSTGGLSELSKDDGIILLEVEDTSIHRVLQVIDDNTLELASPLGISTWDCNIRLATNLESLVAFGALIHPTLDE